MLGRTPGMNSYERPFATYFRIYAASIIRVMLTLGNAYPLPSISPALLCVGRGKLLLFSIKVAFDSRNARGTRAQPFRYGAVSTKIHPAHVGL